MDMLKKIPYRQMIWGLALLIVFALPFHIQATRYLIGGFVGIWLLEVLVHPDPRRTPRLLIPRMFHQPLIWLVIAFYMLHIMSLVVSGNFDRALFDLEKKLTLLLLPLVFSAIPPLEEKRQHHVLLSFVAANLVIAIVCSISFVAHLADPSYFKKFLDYPLYYIYSDFSLFNHPTYFGLLMELSLVFLFYLYHTRQRLLSGKWILILVVFFSVVVLLVSSRAAIVALVVLFVLTIFFYSRRLLVRLALLAGLVVLFMVALTNYRFDNYLALGREIVQGKDIRSQELIEQDAMRFLLWDVAVDLALQDFWRGTGTGDIQKDLKQEYQKRDILRYMDRTYNPHNQYLSTLLGVGIFGLLILLAMLIWPLILAFRRRDYLASGFLVLFMLHFVFESMLSRSPAILSFAFFYGLIVMYRYRKPEVS